MKARSILPVVTASRYERPTMRDVADQAGVLNVAGGAAQHAFGFEANSYWSANAGIDGYDGWLIEHNAAATLVHQRVCCAEVNR